MTLRDGHDTVLVISRGERLGELFSAVARHLSRQARIVALIDETERLLREGFA